MLNSRARASDLGVEGWALAFSVFDFLYNASGSTFKLLVLLPSTIWSLFSQWVLMLLRLLSYPTSSGSKSPMRRTTLGTASRMRRFRALFPLPTTKEYIPLFEDVDLEDYIVSIDCWFPYDITIPDTNTYAMVNGKFALRVLENSNPTLRVCASSITPYVILLYFIYSSCLCSDLFSVSLPGREDIAALYQKGTIHTTVHLIGRVV